MVKGGWEYGGEQNDERWKFYNAMSALFDTYFLPWWTLQLRLSLNYAPVVSAILSIYTIRASAFACTPSPSFCVIIYGIRIVCSYSYRNDSVGRLVGIYLRECFKLNNVDVSYIPIHQSQYRIIRKKKRKTREKVL